MKKLFILLFVTTSLVAQNQYNTKKGYVAEGYDVVSYFSNDKPVEGSDKFETTFDNVKFKFVSEANLNLFKANPKKYVPQYDGYCAYAIGAKGKKFTVDPNTFEIRDGKLFLFYNKGKTNTLKFWLDQNPDELKQKADKNWEKIIKN